MRLRCLGLAAAIFLAGSPGLGQTSPAEVEVGDRFLISLHHESESSTSDGSGSSSSSGGHQIMERVLAVYEQGIALEYDFPPDTSDEDRKREWEFPLQVFRPSDGEMRLLNRHALEKRRGEWLKRAGWTDQICGDWIFTWNAFYINCDPEKAVESITPFGLRFLHIEDGMSFTDPLAAAPGEIKKIDSEPSGDSFSVQLQIDPEAVRKERAQSDVVVAKFSGKTVTFEEALEARRNETIDGTMTIRFDTDVSGDVVRRIKSIELKTTDQEGVIETERLTKTTSRQPLSKDATGGLLE